MPAIAVADALRAEGAEVSFLGTRERAEADLVPAAGFEIDFLRVSGLDRRNPLKAARAALTGLRRSSPLTRRKSIS
ncbi:MAG: glycosyltransferase [Solirubrobacterales bacterium]